MKQLFFSTVFAFSSFVVAQPAGGKKTVQDVTVEQRSQMAAAHEKMAVCLRSDKPISDCRTEMHDQCQNSMGKDGCSMMDMMGGKMGPGKHHMHRKMKSKDGGDTK